MTEKAQNDFIYTKNKDLRFIGFARIFSGIIRRGNPIYVIGPKIK